MKKIVMFYSTFGSLCSKFKTCGKRVWLAKSKLYLDFSGETEIKNPKCFQWPDCLPFLLFHKTNSVVVDRIFKFLLYLLWIQIIQMIHSVYLQLYLKAYIFIICGFRAIAHMKVRNRTFYKKCLGPCKRGEHTVT